MSVRVKRYLIQGNEQNDLVPGDDTGTIADRETTVDGQTFHWGPNQVRNFLDDSVGKRHAAFTADVVNQVEDNIPFGSPRS
jgi:hypothetical protein